MREGETLQKSVYYGQYSEGVDEEVLVTLWKVVGGLLVVSMLKIDGFLKLINKDYTKTFFDARTGNCSDSF